MPVHNAAPWLGEALASVARQSMADFELLALDDGSTDGSGALLAAWARRESRLAVLTPGRVGLPGAINRLCEAARAPLLARIDADDVMHPRRLELQCAALDDDARVDVVSCLVRHFPRPVVLGGNLRYEEWLNGLRTPGEVFRDRFVESPVANPSATFRRSVFEVAGPYRDDGLPEDYAFWLRALEAGVRVVKLPRVLHFWRDHGGRVTRTHRSFSLQAFLRAKSEALLAGPLADGRPYVVWGAGMTGRRLTRLLIRAGRPPRALLDIDPRKIGRTRHGIPVIPADAFRPRSALVLGAVGAIGARALIRERLDAAGHRETEDYWMVA